MQINTIIIMSLYMLSFTVFSQNSDYIIYEHDKYQFPYQLEKPDNYWELPDKLQEISGLGYITINKLALVQDEKGILFVFNTNTGRIEREIKFDIDGDYEGVEIVGKDAWILKSNGVLYIVKDFLINDTPYVQKLPTSLTRINDTEGLGYNNNKKTLLIACKGYPYIDNPVKNNRIKSIFSFNIETKKINPIPIILIEINSIIKRKRYNTITLWGLELLDLFDSYKGDVTFQPSGIAIHPISRNVYVLGSVGKMLIVYSEEGELLAMIELNPKTYAQPEGICFDTKGCLYISNEGKENKANILMMKMKNK